MGSIDSLSLAIRPYWRMLLVGPLGVIQSPKRADEYKFWLAGQQWRIYVYVFSQPLQDGT